jgi:hypothetical protein
VQGQEPLDSDDDESARALALWFHEVGKDRVDPEVVIEIA